MRISGPGRSAALQVGAGARRADGTGAVFAPATSDPAPRAATSAAPSGIGSLDALIALQAVDADRPSRRRRAARRGHDLLDVLEEIRIGLLSGGVHGASLDRIAMLLAGLEPSGDEALDALIADIALRAEVELAKLGRYLAET
jgi:hypothetical protein